MKMIADSEIAELGLNELEEVSGGGLLRAIMEQAAAGYLLGLPGVGAAYTAGVTIYNTATGKNAPLV